MAEVLEENNYYAFGLKHSAGMVPTANAAYSYGYNGKELQKETGWGDYGARMYMADIGRWGVIDPLAEQMRRYSPYNYAFNNPVSFIDPDGMAPHQFKMPGDSRPDAYSGGHNPNWLGLGNTGNLESGGYGGGNGYSVLSSLGNSNDYLLDNLIAGWASQGIDAKISKNGYLSYWTGGAAGYGSTSQEMVAHMINISGSKEEIYSPLSQGNTLLSFNGVYMTQLSYREYIGTAKPNVPFKYRGIKYYGNGRTFLKSESLVSVRGVIKIGKFLGPVTVGLGAILDYGYGVKEYERDPNSPNAVSPNKAHLNAVMGLYGLSGVGTIPSVLYFGIDSFYPGGIVGASKTAARTEAYEQQITGHPLFSNSALKF
ncbi:RHS repeat domain-containing protein [Chryseobacterium sp. 22532]|uniref:RHS repeat domain-containing protein n=1 Tax=Chryseobacterium sp. 22532 TaxID=3453938 RepID=UPI003F85C980